MFIDELKIHIKAGKGGDGVVRWRHEKGKEFSGPSGGNGGHGASVFVKGVKDISILSKFKNLKNISAERGQDGMKNSRHGKNGEDLILEFPVGSVLTNLRTGQKFSLEKEGQIIKILSGGKGGLGNEYFKSSTNINPKNFTLGKEGEKADFFIELELIADLGLIGLPNAGKTSLLNTLSYSKYKIGDYPFTTLGPNLGVVSGYVLADIPGLIEDSSKGKGLGFKFLRHIKRTRVLLHCISADNKNITKAYKTIKEELKSYDKDLLSKKELVILTKSDTVPEEELKEKKKFLENKLKKKVFQVSILDDSLLKEFKDELIKNLREISDV